MITIDEEIVLLRNSASKALDYKWQREQYQLAEWLEELKAYREIGTVEECRNSVLDIERAYNKGYADGSLSVTSEIRNKVIDDFAERLSEYLNVENATKYGNENAEQQRNSYDTLMKYEIADAIDDVTEQLKAGEENGKLSV